MPQEPEHAPDLPETAQDELVEKIRDLVAKTTQEAIAPLRDLLAPKEPEPPKGEDVGGKTEPETSHLREHRAAYERAGLHEHMPFDDFIKGLDL